MTIEEAKAAKAALRERLAQALREFTKDTGLTVDCLELDLRTSLRGVYDYSVHAEVRL